MNATALMIDMQDSLIGVMSDKDELLRQSEILLRGLEILGVHIIATEQYPEKLGSTSEIFTPFLRKPAFKKTAFSALTNDSLRAEILEFEYIIVLGVEAHICVLQSVKDLLGLGKKVILIEPCTSSRNTKNKALAVATIRQMGAEISSVESILFEILRDAKHEKFKEISKLIK